MGARGFSILVSVQAGTSGRMQVKSSPAALHAPRGLPNLGEHFYVHDLALFHLIICTCVLMLAWLVWSIFVCPSGHMSTLRVIMMKTPSWLAQT